MITQTEVGALRDIDGLDWITPARPEAIKDLVKSGAVQIGLFDERNLFELMLSDFHHGLLESARARSARVVLTAKALVAPPKMLG